MYVYRSGNPEDIKKLFYEQIKKQTLRTAKAKASTFDIQFSEKWLKR
ncbi:hypothetical protein KY325_03410 [Candidatus Woesearchaeota archaeon]|nr:hypothetical protein [Candidatus Woesearchaeota archaeon]MBW3018181.1 hypothetical protein [Candidatus Woesearchaeota archaeon]